MWVEAHHLSNNHMWEEAYHLAFMESMVGSSEVIKFLVSMGTVLSFSSLLQSIVQMFPHSYLHIRVNFESTS